MPPLIQNENSTTAPAPTEPLLPCPFCGKAPKVVDYHGNYNQAPDWCVHCESCDLSLDGDKTPAEAVIRWNRRPNPSAEMIEAGAAGMYGSKWNDPRDDHRPGEAMKDVWRKYARDCLTAALRPTPVSSRRPE